MRTKWEKGKYSVLNKAAKRVEDLQGTLGRSKKRLGFHSSKLIKDDIFCVTEKKTLPHWKEQEVIE